VRYRSGLLDVDGSMNAACGDDVLPGIGRPRTARSPAVVVVVGAGISGLVTALRVLEGAHGPCRVVVLEAEPEPGGLARSFEMSGRVVDRFYHFICTPDRRYLGLLRELGLASRVRWTRTRMGLLRNGGCRPFHSPMHLALYPGVPLSDKLGYGTTVSRCRRMADWKPLEDARAQQWLRDSVGARGYEEWWDQLLTRKFGHHAPKLSAAWIMARVRRNARSRYLQLWDRVGCLEGGTGQVADALAARIAALAGDIRVASSVSRIVHESGRVSGVVVDGSVVPADAVVYTGRLVDLPTLLGGCGPTRYLRQLQSLEDIGVVCTLLRLRHSLSSLFWLNVLDPAIPHSGIIEFSRLWSSRPWHLLYIPEYGHVDLSSTSLDPHERTAMYEPLLRAVNPRFSPDWVDECRVFAATRAQPVCNVGFSKQLPPVRTPIAGLWAADYSHVFPEDRSLAEIVTLAERVARDVVRWLARDPVRTDPPPL
jgi:protoporphyrinogen oxidase